MVIYKQAHPLSETIASLKKSGKRIGFAPTMGALHAGHLSLIKRSSQENEITVSSIFVNPTQFNNPDDLKHYPVTIEKDLEQLLATHCDILFLPPVEEIYPPGYQKKLYPLGKIETILEGYYRPGHFQGVCQVVDRMLDIVSPDRLYLGQKDYQQCMVIQKLLQLTDRKEVELRICPTQREEDGLAMSSRNLRLPAEDRKKAPAIFAVLTFMKTNWCHFPVSDLKKMAKLRLEDAGFQVDYVEVANADTLEPTEDKTKPLVALIAASLKNIRLIDNLMLHS